VTITLPYYKLQRLGPDLRRRRHKEQELSYLFRDISERMQYQLLLGLELQLYHCRHRNPFNI